MSNYNSLKVTIDANIKQNGNQEITGQILNSVLNQMVNILGAGYQFAGVATIATDPGTPDAKVFYIANGKGNYEKFDGINVTEDDVVILYYDTAWHKVSTGIASDKKLSELNSLIALVENSEYAEILIDDDYKILEVVTKQGTRIFFGGLNIKGEFIPETLKIADEIYSPIDSNVYLELMTDYEGKIISSLIPDGTHYFAKLKSPTIDAIINRLDAIDVNSLLPWNGKYAVFYGDSVTASSNPGEIAPFDAGSVKWATMVARKLGLREYKCRGIGGATWSPMNKIAYIAPNGEPAENTITNYTKETAPHRDGYTIVDGGLSTWERITNQIPSSIREDVDLVFVFCHNQEPSGEFSPSYSTSDVWDTLWKNDVTFNPFGGDYNIADCSNAIVSTIQKLQAWCPNARIVIGTGVSGRGSNDAHNTTDLSLSMSLQGKQEIVKRIANIISTPCIDIWGTDGINIFNRSKYIKDGVHPNNDGNVELANAIAAGLSVIYPKKYRI